MVFALVIQGATLEPDTFILFHTLVWLVAWQRLSKVRNSVSLHQTAMLRHRRM
jgi:hypothetical protein